MSIEEIEKRNDDVVDNRLRGQSLVIRIVVVIGVLGGTALAGLSQFFLSNGDFQHPSWWQVVGCIGILAAFLAGIYVASVDSGAPEQLLQARMAINAAKKAEREAKEAHANARELEMLFRYKTDPNSLDDDAKRARELYLSVNAMRGAVEQFDPRNPVSVERFPISILAAADTHIQVALGFSLEQHWTLDVFQARTNGDGVKTLHLVATKRSLECDMRDARAWPVGTGFAGVTYAKGHEIIISDTREAAIAQLFSSPHGLGRPHDTKHYVSFAAVPIVAGSSNEIWGVVIATNNQPSHFSLDEDTSGAPYYDGVKSYEGVRAVAGMIALGVAAQQRHSSAAQDAQKPLGETKDVDTDAKGS